MSLLIYNTLTKKKEPFQPLESGKVKMYVCGVTVYDLCHIGHARSAIVFDVIYRYLKHKGYDVVYVRNFTDIDDKIIKRANEEGSDYKAISERFIKAFYEDMDPLGVLRPTVEPRATQHIREMIEIIKILMDKGIAYEAEGDVYFSVEKFPRYGCLSGRTLEDMVAGARIEVDEKKQNPFDFVLWKGSKPGEPWWESPWGKGRPGWHIECSAMSHKYLGKTFDIHGGGKDLIFPHHENEIAQSEAAFDAKFVNYWVHNGFVNINSEKMSKSLGNFLTIRNVLERVHPEALRLFVLGKHYRSPVDFSDENILEAEKALEKLYATMFEAYSKLPPEKDIQTNFPDKAYMNIGKELFEKIRNMADAFEEAMDNDFNTAQAIGVLFELRASLQKFLEETGKKKLKGPSAALVLDSLKVLKEFANILGILERTPEEFWKEQRNLKLKLIGLSADEIEKLIKKREKARKEKRFDEADTIRNQLAEKGIRLEDTPQGTRWKVVGEGFEK